MLKQYDKQAESEHFESKNLETKPIEKLDKHISELIETPGEVIDLTEGNFETARDKPGILFVKFYAPW
jgi:hypothetical protein